MFVSYSSDDSAIAVRLHKALERFRIPRHFKDRTLNGEPVPRRLKPSFLDRLEVAGSSDLGAELTRALESSRYLLVVCSPRAARSKWVNEEVVRFRDMGRQKHVHAVLIEGEPGVSFPPALRGAIQGTDSETGALEPVAPKLQDGHDSLRMAVARLVAGMLDVPFVDVWNRHLIERRRRIAAATAAAAAVIVTLTVTANTAIRNERIARATEIVEQQSALMVASPRAALREILSAYEIADIPLTVSAMRTALENANEVARLDHGAPVTGLVSMEGGGLLTADSSTVWRWLEDGAPEVVFQGSRTEMPLLSDRRGKALARLEAGRVRLRSTPGETWVGEGSLTAADLSPDGRYLATGDRAGRVRIWDVETGEPEEVGRHAAPVRAVAFDAGGGSLFSTGNDQVTHCWKVGSAPCGTFQHDVRMDRIVPFDDGDAFAAMPRPVPTAQAFPKPQVWSRRDSLLLWEVQEEGLTTAIGVDPTGHLLAVGRADGAITVWNLISQSDTPAALLLGHEGRIREIEFDRSDPLLVYSAAEDSTARRWDLSNGGRTFLPADLGGQLRIIPGPLGRRALTVNEGRGSAELWDLASGRSLRRFTHVLPDPAFSPSGALVVTAGLNESAMLWDANDGAPRGPVGGIQTRAVRAAFLDSDERLVLVGQDGTVEFRQGTRTVARHAGAPGSRGIGLAVAPGGLWAAVAADSLVRVFHGDGEPAAELEHQARVTGLLSFAPNARHLAVPARDATVSLWETSNWTRAAQLPHPSGVTYLAFDRGGDLLATVTLQAPEAGARIWEVESGRILGVLHEAEGFIDQVAFSPDGTRVALVGEGPRAALQPLASPHTVLWDLSGDDPLRSRIEQALGEDPEGQADRLPGHRTRVQAVAFTPDGRFVLTASKDGTVRKHLVHPDSLVTLARRVAEAYEVRSTTREPGGR